MKYVNLIKEYILFIVHCSLSSAKWGTLQCFIATCRSLMYIRKSKGPKTDPCGTPHVILEVLDSKPLIDTNCLWFAKYASNHLFANIFLNSLMPHIP